MLYSQSLDKYFDSESDINEALEEYEENLPVDLLLVICQPNNYSLLNYDYWEASRKLLSR